MGNDRLQAYGIERQEKFQSTFPRGERRLSYEATSRDMSISIHVPSWGTTLRCIRWYRTVRISIHVPSWGTTAQAGYNQWDNPISIHVPSWGTTDLTSKQKAFADISIHVPSWGTTANFHKYSLFFYAINIIFLLFIIPSLFSLVLFMLLF